MENVNWRDVAHLYLGCQVMHEGNCVRFAQYDLTENIVSVNYGVMGPEYRYCDVDDIKPLLLRLSSIPAVFVPYPNAADFLWMLNHSYDLFGLIDKGQAVDAATLATGNQQPATNNKP